MAIKNTIKSIFFLNRQTFNKKICFRTTAHWAHSTLIAGLAQVRVFVFNDARCLNTAEATGLQNNAEREEKSRELRVSTRQTKIGLVLGNKTQMEKDKTKDAVLMLLKAIQHGTVVCVPHGSLLHAGDGTSAGRAF